MTPDREREIGILGSALGQIVNSKDNDQDPVLAGGMCLLHTSNKVSCVSVETESSETGGLILLAVALLTALVEDERDPRVKGKLQQALAAANEAQIANVTVDDKMLIN